MSNITLSIQRALQCCSVQTGKEKELICFAVASTLAYTLTLPSAPVVSIAAFYNSTHSASVDAFLSECNEQFVFNAVLAQDYVRKCFAFRYSMVYDACNPHVVDIVSAMFAADNSFLPPDLIDISRRNLTNEGFETLRDLIWRFSRELNESGSETAPASPVNA